MQSNDSGIRPFHPADLVFGVADQQVGVGLAFNPDAGAGMQNEQLGGGVGETGSYGDLLG